MNFSSYSLSTKKGRSFPNRTLLRMILLFSWPLTPPTNPPLEKPVRQHSPHSEHSSPPYSPALQHLQQVCTILIFPSHQLISLPTQHLPKQAYIFLPSSSKHHHLPEWHNSQTPDHTTPSHTAPISISFPTTRTLYTYTLITFTPHSSALHNTTHWCTYLLLQDRQPYAVEHSLFSWRWA